MCRVDGVTSAKSATESSAFLCEVVTIEIRMDPCPSTGQNRRLIDDELRTARDESQEVGLWGT